MNVIMPQLGETVTEGTVSAWYKKAGDAVQADEILLDVETDKVATEITAPVGGVVAEIRVGQGETVGVGTILAVIREDGEADATQTSSAGNAAASAASESSGNGRGKPTEPRANKPLPRSPDGKGPPLSPAVRRLLAENNVDPVAVSGTGRDGRIRKSDVVEYLKRAGNAAQGDAGNFGEAGIKPFSRIRKITAERMVQSKATSAHVLQAVEVDFTAVDRCRDRVKVEWKKRYGFSLTYLPFISSAVCEALKAFPDLNSSVQGDGLQMHDHVNLAIAVDLGAEGLVAPVIPAADRMSVSQLAHAIHDSSSQSRAGELKNDQLSGGTFTISNSGTFGTLITAPVINQPQVAILSVDGICKRPVVVERTDGDSIAIRRVGILAQSFDHRAVDGAYSAAFLSALRERLETHEWQVET